LKLILEVYETFTYPSREGRARSGARSCDTQAVSLLYLETTYNLLNAMTRRRSCSTFWDKSFPTYVLQNLGACIKKMKLRRSYVSTVLQARTQVSQLLLLFH